MYDLEGVHDSGSDSDTDGSQWEDEIKLILTMRTDWHKGRRQQTVTLLTSPSFSGRTELLKEGIAQLGDALGLAAISSLGN